MQYIDQKIEDICSPIYSTAKLSLHGRNNYQRSFLSCSRTNYAIAFKHYMLPFLLVIHLVMDSQRQKVIPVASITSYADMGFVLYFIESTKGRAGHSSEKPGAQNYYYKYRIVSFARSVSFLSCPSSCRSEGKSDDKKNHVHII